MIGDIVRWDPFREMASLRDEMDRALARMRGGAAGAGPPWTPVSDVHESGDAIVITAELPGVKDEDIDISVQDGMLAISGERRLAEDVTEDGYRHVERSYGGFRRTFRLPDGAREEDISAATSYGVLKITIPKPAAGSPRRIPVNGGS
ncbi:Hsp20/alpha crystallin family protein [Miltoncostaea marina]|uniref:Hsp20/alpha crystallin family protein n=1 Tax=Miltoncostaea marina TaxID=2843215 RepID=UPI001C3D66CE|nr:Hsp20/alpha crystallin family protein [Miltoncostaea marina]